CWHNSCVEKHWKDFRKHFEPEYEKRQRQKSKRRESSLEAPLPEPPRIAQLTRPAESVTFEQWRGVIKANFSTLVRPAEICASVLAQLLLNDVSNPFALALVDVPASGKTITLNFFDGTTELTYTTDNFPPAAFVSHASNVKR